MEEATIVTRPARSDSISGKRFEKEAADFRKAIERLAENPDNLDALESYLSRHFGAWLSSYAKAPQDIADEMLAFADMVTD